MASREMTLIEELKSFGIGYDKFDDSVLKRWLEKSKHTQEHIETLEDQIIDLNAKLAVMDHDNHIQERIILQLNYEKHKDFLTNTFR